MLATPDAPRFEELSRKWLALAELYRSGSWQRYYTKESFALLMHDVIGAVKAWKGLARPEPPPAADMTDLHTAA